MEASDSEDTVAYGMGGDVFADQDRAAGGAVAEGVGVGMGDDGVGGTGVNEAADRGAGMIWVAEAEKVAGGVVDQLGMERGEIVGVWEKAEGSVEGSGQRGEVVDKAGEAEVHELAGAEEEMFDGQERCG